MTFLKKKKKLKFKDTCSDTTTDVNNFKCIFDNIV